MAANTITRGRLRRLADVRPAQGRVLSVFLNLDPAEFATPAARSSAITSVMTDAARKVEAADGTRAVAVYACHAEDLLELVSLRHPLESRVVLERTPYVEPLVDEGAPE